MNEAVCAIKAKQPHIGRTKTRLSPPLTPQQATVLSEALLCDVIALVDSQPGIDLVLAISPPSSQPFFTMITLPDTRLLPVERGDIGECLSQVFSLLSEMGWQKVLALNADGPSLNCFFLVPYAAVRIMLLWAAPIQTYLSDQVIILYHAQFLQPLTPQHHGIGRWAWHYWWVHLRRSSAWQGTSS